MRYCSQCKQTFSPPEGNAGAEPDVCPVCGTALTERRILAPGTVVNGFSIVRELGHGGMGVVYLAKQVNLERYVALKVLEDSLTGDQEFVDGFFREARSAASLSHPNIVQAYDAGIAEGGIYFFVMELIDGENLDRYIAGHGPLELVKGLEIASSISHALSYAWEHQHLSHGDIKPENIILKADGEVKLADLGLARDYRKEVLRPGEIMATPAYAPPEIIRAESEKIGFRSDMYSFGATLYHLFAGVPPFPGDDPVEVCTMQLNNQPKPLIAVRNEIPSQLSMLVDKLMEKSPNNRPESWEKVAESIDAILNGLKHVQEKEDEAVLRETRIQNRIRLRRTVIGSLAALALLLIALAAVLAVSKFRDGDEPAVPSALPSGSEDGSDPRDVSQKASRTKALAKWNFLKTRLPAMDTETARRELKKYLDEHTFDVEEEALAYDAFLGRKDTFEKGLRDFKKRLRTLENECRAKKYVRSSREDELKKAVSALASLFDENYAALCEQASQFGVEPASLDEGKKPMLDEYRRTLETRLHQIRDGRLAAAREKQRAEREKSIRRENEKRELLESCQAEFKAICAEVPAVHDRESAQQLSESLEKWKSRYASSAPADCKDGAALLQAVLPDAFVPEYKLLRQFRSRLAGREILPGHQFSDVSEKGLICQRNKDGLLVEEMISWSKIRKKSEGSVLYRIGSSADLLERLDADQQTKLFKCLLAEWHKEDFYQAYLDRSVIPADRQKKLMHAARYYLSLLPGGGSSGEAVPEEP